MTHSTSPVLAIGIDAAEPTVIRRLIGQGRLPSLARLLDTGHWRTVTSPADIGSGSVWPTFMTGEHPRTHGAYAEWAWQPETMTVERYTGDNVTPFWQALADAGTSIGMLDVPFAPRIGLTTGFEITEWGPHDRCDGQRHVGPSEVDALVAEIAPHPFDGGFVDPVALPDRAALEDLRAACLTGIERRGALMTHLLRSRHPDFALTVFTEVHHASHYLWQTIDPENGLFTDLPNEIVAAGFTLDDIYEAIDREIGRIVTTVGETADVTVFSLHGMRASTGIAAFLAPWLTERRFARMADWTTQSWRQRAVSAFGTLKRHSPSILKKLYYTTLPSHTTRALAQPTMLPGYDWSRTRAFALPSDQHGWVRVNLAGREAGGIVTASEYAGLCEQLTTAVTALRSEAGEPLVKRVVATNADVGQALTSPIPDLVVHWTDAALRSPLRIRDSRLTAETIGQKFTSQHEFDGFCIHAGPAPRPAGPTVAATSLGDELVAAVRRIAPAQPDRKP